MGLSCTKPAKSNQGCEPKCFLAAIAPDFLLSPCELSTRIGSEKARSVGVSGRSILFNGLKRNPDLYRSDRHSGF